MKPTKEQFDALQSLFDYYNDKLFAGTLPQIILNLSRSKPNIAGFFAPKRWKKVGVEEAEGNIHEISLNPEFFLKDKKELMQTLVHEMTHLWQEVFGKPSRKGYHNKEWADKMEAIGLMPTSTGLPGGKRTGQKMSDYAIEGGRFESAYEQMDKDLFLPFEHVVLLVPKKKAKPKTKYICLCDNTVYGKGGLSITCEDCKNNYIEQE